MGTPTTGGIRRGPESAPLDAFPGLNLKFRSSLPVEGLVELPPLPQARPVDPGSVTPPVEETPAWSPVKVAAPLFGLVWVCFAVLAATVTVSPATDVVGLARVIGIGAGVVALVLLTLSVAHTQISGLSPRPAVLAVVAVGLGQGFVADALGSGRDDLWGIAAWVFVLIGVTVPLMWVGSQFQRGVRLHRVERSASLTASWIEKARHQAHETVQSVHRHDVRSMLFVIDGAARTLAGDGLSPEQRTSFAEMLGEGVQRLGAMMDVRTEEIAPIAVDDVARAVVHAKRKAGYQLTADVPAGLTALGRAADVTAVFRTLVRATGRNTDQPVQIRAGQHDGIVTVRIEPAGSDDLALLMGNWEAIWAESFKPTRNDDEESVDLYVAARLLAEQGADVWSTAGRTRFTVRLPAVANPGSQEEA